MRAAVLRLIVVVSLALSSPSASAQAPQLPDYIYPLAMDAGRMSIAVYGRNERLVTALQLRAQWDERVFRQENRAAIADLARNNYRVENLAGRMPSRNWWTGPAPGKPTGQMLTEARVMADMARDPRRVLVVGDWPGRAGSLTSIASW